MKTLLVFLLILLASPEAWALKTSPNALRIVDSKSGNLVLGADHAAVEEGEIYKTILVLWGNLEVRGQVEELVLLSGSVKFHPGSKLEKSLVVVGGNYEALPGADVAGEKVSFRAASPFWSLMRSGGNLWRNYYEGTAKIIASLSLCFVLWIFGLVLFAVFPKLQMRTEGILLREWPKNLMAGMIGTILSPVLFVLLIFSIVGILALPFYVLLLGMAGFVSYLAAALWVGHRLWPAKANQRLNPWAFFLGLIVLQIFWYSGVWYGFLLVMILWTMSWGTLVRALRTLWA